MKYTQAREIVESALDALLNEALVRKKVKNPNGKAAKNVNPVKKPKKFKYTDAMRRHDELQLLDLRESPLSKNKMKYPEKEYNSKEHSKPSMPSVKKPSSPSPSSGLSPAVKMGARNTNARWRRGNRWVLKQIKKRQASAVHEMAQTNARYRQMGDEIEKATVAYQQSKPGAERRLQSLLKKDAIEARSGTLYGRGGKKIKNPKKHRDSRPLGEAAIEEIMESHNIETLEKLPLGRLKKLHNEYKNKGTEEAAREASNIKRIIASRMNEAVSTNDPKRGKAGRAKPKLPPGQDPYDMYTKGAIKPYGGKTQKRLSSLSPESRKRYYQEVGIRSRAASRAGTTGRLYPQG